MKVIESSPPASITLEATNLTHDDLNTLSQFIQSHGAYLSSLNASLQDVAKPYHHDWQAINFIEMCPKLTSLTLSHINVNDSVLVFMGVVGMSN